MGSERRVVTHCSFCYNDVFEDGTHASAEAGRACDRDSDLARVTAQRAAAAAMQEAERAVLDAAITAREAWLMYQRMPKGGMGSFIAEQAAREADKAASAAIDALIALRAGA